MAAALGLAVDETRLASPELALVDAALAAELRLSLPPVEGTEPRGRASFEEAPAASDESAPPQRDVEDEFGEAEAGAAELHLDAEYIGSVTEEMPAQSQTTSSHHPVLPAPEAEDAIGETDAALRRIRERLTDESPDRGRRLRRRFTVASGASAVCALGVLAVDVAVPSGAATRLVPALVPSSSAFSVCASERADGLGVDWDSSEATVPHHACRVHQYRLGETEPPL